MDLGLVGRILEVTVLLHAEALVEAIILLGGILIGLQTEVAAGNKPSEPAGTVVGGTKFSSILVVGNTVKVEETAALEGHLEGHLVGDEGLDGVDLLLKVLGGDRVEGGLRIGLGLRI